MTYAQLLNSRIIHYHQLAVLRRGGEIGRFHSASLWVILAVTAYTVFFVGVIKGLLSR